MQQQTGAEQYSNVKIQPSGKEKLTGAILPGDRVPGYPDCSISRLIKTESHPFPPKLHFIRSPDVNTKSGTFSLLF